MEEDVIGKVAAFFAVAVAIGVGFIILGNYSGNVDESTIGTAGGSIDLSANSDLVVNSGYPDFLAGDSSFGTGTTQTQRHFFSIDNQAKIRQDGTSTQLTFELSDDSNSTSFNSFYVSVWRYNATETGWNQVDTTGNILSKVQAETPDTTVTIALDPSEYLTHQEGDYVQFGWTNDVDGSNPSIIETYLDAGSTSSYFFDDTPIGGTTDIDWTSGSANDNWAIIKLKAQAPSIAFIGDSITAGHTGHYSYIEETSSNDDHTASYPYKVGQTLGVAIQNMGEGSPDNTSSDGLARFTEDVVALKPKVVVIGYGTADINSGVSLSTFSSNMQAMITEAKNAGITPVLQEVYPRDFDTDTKDDNRLLFNAEIRSLAETNDIEYVSNEDIGNGGDPNALAGAYDSGDGIHPNEAGYVVIASNTVDAINSISTNSWVEIYQNYESQSQSGMGLLSIITIAIAAVIIIGVIKFLLIEYL